MHTVTDGRSTVKKKSSCRFSREAPRRKQPRLCCAGHAVRHTRTRSNHCEEQISRHVVWGNRREILVPAHSSPRPSAALHTLLAAFPRTATPVR
jgi:hypothetical protein